MKNNYLIQIMRINIILIPLFIISQGIVSAQQVSLKHPLTKADYLSLDTLTKNSVSYSVKLSVGSPAQFLSDNDVRPDKPSSLKKINKLKKNIKGNCVCDAMVYSAIGSTYRKLSMHGEADKNFDKSIELANQNIQSKPDSASAYNLLGTIYAQTEKFGEAAQAFRQSYEMTKNDSANISLMKSMAFCYLFSGNYDTAIQELDKAILQQPDNAELYIIYSVIQYFKKGVELHGLSNEGKELLLKGKNSDEIIDLSRLKSALERNNNIWFEWSYNFSRHLSIFLKCAARSTSVEPPPPSEYFTFPVEDKDSIELNDLETFYKSLLKDSRIDNPYLLNRTLGNICLLKGNHNQAIPYLKRAVQLKPLKKSTFSNNASDDFDNLASAYLLMKDTISYEKTVKEKFKVRPAIDPLSSDYVSMAHISFAHNQYADAEKYATEALRMNPKELDAYICLASMDVLKRDFQNAFKKLDEVYKINEGNAAMYLLTGICQLHQNDVNGAYATFQFAKLAGTDAKWVDNKIINKYFEVRN